MPVPLPSLARVVSASPSSVLPAPPASPTSPASPASHASPASTSFAFFVAASASLASLVSAALLQTEAVIARLERLENRLRDSNDRGRSSQKGKDSRCARLSSTPRRSNNTRQRSASPTRRTDSARAPRQNSPAAHKSFRDVKTEHKGDRPLSICAICLGRHPHDVAKCSSSTLWNGGTARCSRNDRGRIVNPHGVEVCTEFQREQGCTSRSSRHVHECSGCGKSTHGADTCSLAQKA